MTKRFCDRCGVELAERDVLNDLWLYTGHVVLVVPYNTPATADAAYCRGCVELIVGAAIQPTLAQVNSTH